MRQTLAGLKEEMDRQLADLRNYHDAEIDELKKLVAKALREVHLALDQTQRERAEFVQVAKILQSIKEILGTIEGIIQTNAQKVNGISRNVDQQSG